MALLGKKKDKKKDPKSKRQEPGVSPDGKPLKPDWMRQSKTELSEVETAIDLGADRQSRSNIMKMYEDKYGEKLEAPEFSAGLRYEYQLYDEADVVTKRDRSFLEDGKKGEKKEKKEEKVKTGFFGRKKEKKEGKAKGEEPVPMPDGPPEQGVPAEPVEKAPSFLDPDKEVEWGRSGLACIGYGKPLFPIARYVQYRAREPKGWMKALILVDILIIIEIPSWLWRMPGRLGFEIAYLVLKGKAKKMDIVPKEFDSYKSLKAAVAEAEEELAEQEEEERKAKKKSSKKKSSKKKATEA